MKSDIKQKTIKDLNDVGIEKIELTFGGRIQFVHPVQLINGRSWEDLIVELLEMPAGGIPGRACNIELKDSRIPDLHFQLLRSSGPTILMDENRIINNGKGQSYSNSGIYGTVCEHGRRSHWTFSYRHGGDEDVKQHWNNVVRNEYPMPYDPLFITPTFKSVYFNFLSWYYKYLVWDWITAEVGVEPSEEIYAPTYRDVDAAIIKMWSEYSEDHILYDLITLN